MSFLAGDLADLGKYTEITSTNVVEFVEKFVETLTYKLTSSSGQGKRKETSVKNALAANQLLRFFVDSRYKNEDVDHARIKAIVSSVDVNTRNAPKFLGICSITCSSRANSDSAEVGTIGAAPAGPGDDGGGSSLAGSSLQSGSCACGAAELPSFWSGAPILGTST